MVGLAISILWLAIGIICVCGCIWLLLYAIKLFVPIPGRIEQLVWVIVLILCLIYALTLLSGGGGSIAPKDNFKIIDENKKDKESLAVIKIQPSYLINILAGYKIDESHAIELSAEVQPNYPTEVEMEKNMGKVKTTANVNVFLVNIICDLASFGRVTPFFLGGGGIADITFNAGSIFDSSDSNIKIFELEKNHLFAFTVQFGLGLRIEATDYIDLALSAKIQSINNIELNYKKTNEKNILENKITKQRLHVGKITAGIVLNF